MSGRTTRSPNGRSSAAATLNGSSAARPALTAPPLPPAPGTVIEDPAPVKHRAATEVTAYAALFLLALDLKLPAEFSSGLVVVLALLPVWFGAMSRFPLARTVLAGAAAVFVSGVWLAGQAELDHSVAPRGTYQAALQLIGAVGGLGVILWTRRVLPTNRVALALGIGLIASNTLSFRGDPTGNPWKFHFSAPVTIVVLAVLATRNRTTAVVAALTGLSVLAALNDSRSYIGFALLAAGLAVWQRLPRGTGRPRPIRLLILIAVTVVAGYNLATDAIVDGLLGSAVQQRSEQQIQASGSLLAGGRPEWSATLALMHDRPLGYGIGVVPNTHDVAVGREGLAPLHIPTIRGYATNYMFGGQFKLHSVVADLWAMAGPVGLAFGGLLVGMILYHLVATVARRQATAVVIFVCARGLWFLAFGPIGSNLDDVIMAAALVLPPRASTLSHVLGSGRLASHAPARVTAGARA